MLSIRLFSMYLRIIRVLMLLLSVGMIGHAARQFWAGNLPVFKYAPSPLGKFDNLILLAIGIVCLAFCIWPAPWRSMR